MFADLWSTRCESHPGFRRFYVIHGVVHERGAYVFEGVFVARSVSAFLLRFVCEERNEDNFGSFRFR